MEIILKGVITHVLPTQQGVSQTGKPWMKAAYVLEHESGQYSRSCRFDVIGEEKIQRFAIQQGEVLTVHLDIDAHEYNGRWYNDVTAWKVEREQPPQYVAPQAPQAPQQGYDPSLFYNASTAQATQPGGVVYPNYDNAPF